MKYGYKILTRDLRPPIQGGPPVFDGCTPFTTPKVALDESDIECGAGWNFCRLLPDAIRIAGCWPDGRPSRAFVVEPQGHVVDRGIKCRAEQITFVREVTAPEWSAAIHEFSAAFGKHAERMARAQIAWGAALARPRRDPDHVEECLRKALRVRGLDMWELRRYDAARAAWDAWAARDAWAAQDAWATWDAWAARAASADRAVWAVWPAWAAQAARDAWAAQDARDAWAARAVWAVWPAWDAWPARDARAARDAWATWAAWNARDALTVEFAAVNGWTKDDPALLTTGLREAYANGLAVAVPVAKDVLGWAMEVPR